jgi:integrase/recombinase XerD
VHKIYLVVDHQLLVQHRDTVTILTRKEIERLYKAARLGGMYALRDQVLLELYYACGLRRSEGYRLNVADVDLHRHYLVIRKAKNGYARLVPFTPKTGRLFRAYLSQFHARMARPNEPAFLLSIHGKRLQGGSSLMRLKHLQMHGGSMELADKVIGLHTLRHSIATHLLQQGMPLDYIRQFLGHRSMESTQIYTQLTDGVL